MTPIPSDLAPRPTLWQGLLRWRWLLGGAIALAFALGQLAESLLLGGPSERARMWWDVVGWGFLAGLTVWLSLTWASAQERRYQAGLEQALRAQQSLNAQLQRSNGHLALLSEVNQRIADSATLDEVLDAALGFPARLVPLRAAALWLNDHGQPILARMDGVDADGLAALRARFGVAVSETTLPELRLLLPADGGEGACLLVPLRDHAALLGWLELFLARGVALPPDEGALLDTIAGEVAEAIVSARRRSREERALYELERAIADERARIARDIHDGLAQTLAFRRMRIDLWLDWLDSDPQRLRGELVELKTVLREQIAELRRAIFALRPVQFDELGFVGGLHRYIVEFASQQGWTAEVNLAGVPPALSPELEAICFRVVQEALTNTAKHAGASRVEVALDQVDGGLRLTVRDNGRGFEPGQVQAGVAERIGLRQMRERLAARRGQLTVLSQPGRGTEIRAWIPMGGATDGAGTTAAGR